MLKLVRKVVATPFLLVVLATSVAAQTPVPPKPLAPGTPVSAADRAYVIGPDDVIEVSVLGRSDFTTRGRVGQDGTIQLPYLGSVKVGNQTAEQLGAALQHSLESGGYFAHPIVKVEIVSYASRYVVVLGSVTTPGLVPIDRPYRLSEIIARAGGIREGGADYVELKPTNGPAKDIPVATLATGAADSDPFVTAGDKIYVPEAQLFYITGQVKAPGAYPMVAGMTLRMALSRGGGLTDAGSERRIEVVRHGKRIEHVDLDAPIEPGDVVKANEGLF
jgi:polysaccharide export outer membrane protein